VSNDSIGPDSRCEPSPELTVALRAVDSLSPDASRLEEFGVTREDVQAIASAGVLTGSIDGRLTAAQARELQEQLAPASGALWFVAAQHRSPAESAMVTSNLELRDRFAAGLASGAMLGAVSFAHLRRARPTVVAERRESGWSISGRLDWITSWGLADVLLLMAETASGEVVQCLIPAAPRQGLTITGPLSLAAMSGTSTVGAVLDGMAVTDADVAAVLPKQQWSLTDSQRTANVPTAVVGLARAAVNGLLSLAAERDWSELHGLAAEWSRELVTGRARAYELMDDIPAGDAVDERLSLRGSLTKRAQEATAMLVAAQAGRAILSSSAAQRWAREAMFALVQAQTHTSRNALIAAYRGDVRSVADPGAR
jgi:alkylation response protein AidB-like acyl-CoA dehydrogenase